ncbi:MAG: CDGSH iron-sulfur domain-containing protein [Nitrososphaeraceae archaeon]
MNRMLKMKMIQIINKNEHYLKKQIIDLIRDNILRADGSSKEYYTLCRCGTSNNKPFCDGMHKSINFMDDKSE